MKRVLVDLDDNEVLVKFSIDKNCMDDFLGRTLQLTDYVCNCPIKQTEEQREKIAEAFLDDSIYSALTESNVKSTFEVLASPVSVNKYINGEYQEVQDMYMAKKVKEVVDGFFKNDE